MFSTPERKSTFPVLGVTLNKGKHVDNHDIEMGDNMGLAEDNSNSDKDMEEEVKLSSVAESDKDNKYNDQKSLSDDNSNKLAHRWVVDVFLFLFFILRYVLI